MHNVLFIEDEKVATVGVLARADAYKIEIDHARNIDMAVRYMKDKKYDLIILDLMIVNPGTFLGSVLERDVGKQFLVSLRGGEMGEMQTEKNVYVVVVTCVSDYRMKMELSMAKNVEILEKPIGADTILKKCSSILEGKKDGE